MWARPKECLDVLDYWLETYQEKPCSKLAEVGGLWLWSSGKEDKTELVECSAGEVTSEALLFMWNIDGVYYCHTGLHVQDPPYLQTQSIHAPTDCWRIFKY